MSLSLALSFLFQRAKDFWTEAQKIKRNIASVSSIVDRVCTADGIADVFASNYQHLYKSVAHDVNDMNCIISSIDDSEWP